MNDEACAPTAQKVIDGSLNQINNLLSNLQNSRNGLSQAINRIEEPNLTADKVPESPSCVKWDDLTLTDRIKDIGRHLSLLVSDIESITARLHKLV